MPTEANARVEAAVLVPVFRDGFGSVRLVLVERSLVGAHAGQVALPGGRREASDPSSLDAALREAEEEIGLGRSLIDVLSTLEPMDTRTTGFRVHPFVARVRVPAQWKLSRDEITAVLTPTLKDLADPRRRDTTTLSFPGWSEPHLVERVELECGRNVWGLTLRLLDVVLPRLLADEWKI
jgi:8-oxo-dGTP pyrophosphatase MutT (NUDIX family)